MRTIGYDTSHILEHHGIKGQKWGVRRNIKSTSSHSSESEHHGLSRKQKIAIGVGTAALVAATGIAAYKFGVRTGNIDQGEAAYQLRLLTKGFKDKTIKEGQTVLRANKGKMKLSDHSTYFTNKLGDHKKYLTNATGTNMSRSGSDKMYSVAMKAVRNVKVPSQRSQTKEFMKFVKKNPETVAKSLAERYVGVPDHKAVEKATGKFMNEMSSMSKADKSSKLYNKFMESLTEGAHQGVNATHAREQFWKQLQDKGYSAVSDLTDKNSGFTKNPLIAFNANKNFKITSQTPVEEALNNFRRR